MVFKILLLSALGIMFLLLPPLSGYGKDTTKKTTRETWTLQDTVRHALSHSPAVKRQKEAINMREHNVREAQAGYLPKLDVEASGGVGTLPVSRNE